MWIGQSNRVADRECEAVGCQKAHTPSRSHLRSVFILSLALIGAVAPGLAPAQAQDWPTRSVKIIVPNGPGGISDALARLTADRLSKRFGQPFVIENRGGAGGVIGTEYAVRSPNDGYSLYFGGGAQFLVNPLMRSLPYDPLKDLTPISMVSLNGMALVVHPDLPVHSVREFISYTRANPGKINYALAGLGQSSHLASAMLAANQKLDVVPIPYQATPPALVGLVAGTVQMFFGNVSDVLELAASGKVRWLGLSTEKRVVQFPNVPTIAETIPGFVMTGWIGYFAPTGTPPSVIYRVSKALIEICREPEVVKTMASAGIDTIGNSPEEFAAIIRADVPMMRSAVEATGLLKK